MSSRMEMIFIDSEDLARKTNVGAMMDTPAQTWAAFNAARRFAVEYKDAAFLLDYYNKRGDLADTIPVSREGFEAITGERPLTEADYVRIDEEYWAQARADYEARK